MELVAALIVVLLVHGWIKDQRAALVAEIRETMPPPVLPAAPGFCDNPPPVESLPLLPWHPLTPAGAAYRTRQLAYRRAHGLPLDA